MVFSKKKDTNGFSGTTPVERVTSVIGPGINWHGDLKGRGGVRIEGTLEGEVAVRGLIVIGETGRLNCETLQADTVIVSGVVKGNITCGKLEIRATGRVWGDVVTSAFTTEEGAFLRGQMRMEETVELDLPLGSTDTPESEENIVRSEEG